MISYYAAARVREKDADRVLPYAQLQMEQRRSLKLPPSWLRGADCLMAIDTYFHVGTRRRGFRQTSGIYLV